MIPKKAADSEHFYDALKGYLGNVRQHTTFRDRANEVTLGFSSGISCFAYDGTYVSFRKQLFRNLMTCCEIFGLLDKMLLINILE